MGLLTRSAKKVTEAGSDGAKKGADTAAEAAQKAAWYKKMGSNVTAPITNGGSSVLGGAKKGVKGYGSAIVNTPYKTMFATAALGGLGYGAYHLANQSSGTDSPSTTTPEYQSLFSDSQVGGDVTGYGSTGGGVDPTMTLSGSSSVGYGSIDPTMTLSGGGLGGLSGTGQEEDYDPTGGLPSGTVTTGTYTA